MSPGLKQCFFDQMFTKCKNTVYFCLWKIRQAGRAPCPAPCPAPGGDAAAQKCSSLVQLSTDIESLLSARHQVRWWNLTVSKSIYEPNLVEFRGYWADSYSKRDQGFGGQIDLTLNSRPAPYQLVFRPWCHAWSTWCYLVCLKE